MRYFAIIALGLLCSFNSFAQTKVLGTVTDGYTGETLPGANVSYAEGKGTSTDLDGKFVLTIPNGEYTLTVRFVGYMDFTKKISATGKPIDLAITLESVDLNEVEIVADIALGRKTPVAFSDVSAIKIREELGTQDLPLILNSTPGVYATQSGGGDGDARINIRGFNQRNVAVMVDGIPMNDMENGWVYWSNWFGLDAVTQKVQVQRGLGASKLAIPSVGGSINILSQGIEQKQSISISSEFGINRNFRQTIGFNSGRLKNGWGVTAAFSHKTNDGWVRNLSSKQYFYFVKVQKELGKHSLSFSVMGSPQNHNTRPGRRQIYYYDKEYAIENGFDSTRYQSQYVGDEGGYGLQFNQFWGYITRNRDDVNAERELLSDRVNYYHKPIINLKHFWSINKKLALSNIAYASFGNGGGTFLKTSVFDQQTGQLDFDTIYYTNTHGTIFTPIYDLAVVNDTSQYKSSNYMWANVNNHYWVGLLSTLKYRINDNLEFSGGFDGRYYQVSRYQEMLDLLGGDYAVPNSSGDDLNNPTNIVKRVGDRFGYNIQSFVRQAGLFGLLELKRGDWSYFLNATASVVSHSRQNLFGLKDDGGNYPTTGWKTFPAGTVKGGASFNLNKSNSFYVNAGYLSRAPMLNNVFAGTTLTPYRGVENEGIIAAELGYLFNRSIFKSAVNLYYTVWNNRPVNQTISVAGERYFVGIPGMNALHKGVEVEAEAQVHRMVSLEGVLSVGDWRWTSESSAVVFDELGTAPIDTIQFNAKGIKVGDAAQFQAGFGIRFEPVKGLYIKPRITYFDKYYSDFDPESLSAAGEPIQSWKIPSYYTVDLNIGYPFPVWGKYKLGVRLNLLNILNATYISDARNNEYPSTNANDRGFDASSAGVFMGMGFRWNVGVNMNF